MNIFSFKRALPYIFNVILCEKSVDVLVVVNVINHLGGGAAVGLSEKMFLHLCRGEEKVGPGRNGRFAGGPLLSEGIRHVRKVVPVMGRPDGRKHGKEFSTGLEGGMHFFQGEAEGVDMLEAGDGENTVESTLESCGEVFDEALEKRIGLEVFGALNFLNAAGKVSFGAGATASLADFVPVAHGFEGDPLIRAEDVENQFAGKAAADLENFLALKANHGLALEKVGDVVGEAKAFLEVGGLVLREGHAACKFNKSIVAS